MKTIGTLLTTLLLFAISVLAGCSPSADKSSDVSGSVRRSLDQSGFKDVTASDDREKGVVTLGGEVNADGDKTQAESIARSIAGPQVVSNQIAVLPPGTASYAKAMDSDLDEGIEKNLDAALLQTGLKKQVKYAVKSGVVTLRGNVDSQNKRSRAGGVASTVPNVLEVVNEIQIKDQKATSTN
jgi:osmotically-inducible protein OsmY